MKQNSFPRQLGAARGRLKTVATPEDHTDDLNLPPVREVFLTMADVAAVFEDIATFGENIQLMRGRNEKASGDQDTLTLARQSLQEGSVVRVQVRYQWLGQLWIDTFEHRGERVRLVRIAHET